MCHQKFYDQREVSFNLSDYIGSLFTRGRKGGLLRKSHYIVNFEVHVLSYDEIIDSAKIRSRTSKNGLSTVDLLVQRYLSSPLAPHRRLLCRSDYVV